MPRFDMTTIGEGQLRYSVPLGAYLERATQLDVNVTGTEANVSSLLSRLGWRCGWITSLPDSPLGRRVGNEYALSGLDMSAVVWSIRHRLAIYYVEFGTPPKGSQVYYDRTDTCFVNMTRDDIDWDYLLDTRLLHISGLSVPLSPVDSHDLAGSGRQSKDTRYPHQLRHELPQPNMVAGGSCPSHRSLFASGRYSVFRARRCSAHVWN